MEEEAEGERIVTRTGTVPELVWVMEWVEAAEVVKEMAAVVAITEEVAAKIMEEVAVATEEPTNPDPRDHQSRTSRRNR